MRLPDTDRLPEKYNIFHEYSKDHPTDTMEVINSSGCSVILLKKVTGVEKEIDTRGTKKSRDRMNGRISNETVRTINESLYYRPSADIPAIVDISNRNTNKVGTKAGGSGNISISKKFLDINKITIDTAEDHFLFSGRQYKITGNTKPDIFLDVHGCITYEVEEI